MRCFRWPGLYQGVHFLIKRSHCPEAKPNGSSGPGSKRSKMNFQKGSSLREGSMGLGLWRGGQSSQAHFSRKPHPQTQEGCLHLPGARQRCSQHSTPPTVHPEDRLSSHPSSPRFPSHLPLTWNPHRVSPSQPIWPSWDVQSVSQQSPGGRSEGHPHTVCSRPGFAPAGHLAIAGDTAGGHNWGTLLISRGWRPGMLLNIL